MSLTLVPSNHDKWLRVKVRQELDIFEDDHATDLFSTDTFEVQAVPWGDGVMEIRIRPVPPDDEKCIKECQYVSCCVPAEQLERAMAGIADSIFELWYNENSAFDQNMKAVHMYPGHRDITDFPAGYAGFQESEDKPMYVFKQDDWCEYVTYAELIRLTKEIFAVEHVKVLDFRTTIKKVPKNCLSYLYCEAGDAIDPSRF